MKTYEGKLIGIDTDDKGQFLRIVLPSYRGIRYDDEKWIRFLCRNNDARGWIIGTVRRFRADILPARNHSALMIFRSLVNRTVSTSKEIWEAGEKNGGNYE